ncbi:uncharacterized protein LOC120768545 [Bactrocera tryoni]|uniref:uncharacterized protein LOC120768545 n=1 Tax=Bactrocera tryoni TaxID=59916 RepID=UPI001A9765B2|nr:uncharacterized protein LOC120768545 [Bactrocera tryoni]
MYLSSRWCAYLLVHTNRCSRMDDAKSMSSFTATEYDNDELVPPQWLNNGFFEHVLQPQNSGEICQITNMEIQPATKKGEHYASAMFRVKVTFILSGDCDATQCQQTKSFIVKALPELAGEKQRLLENSKLFETEIGIYNDVLPKLVEKLRLAGECIRFGADCLHHALMPNKVLVFDDLKQLGYEIVRNRALTLSEIKAGYLKLAKWHAASYKLTNEQPKSFETYADSFMTLPYVVNSSFISGGIKNFIDMLDTVSSLSMYKSYFQLLQSDWATKCRATYTEYFSNRQLQTWYGICHGDLLANNLMFRHDSLTSELEDVLLVDYQLAYMGPLVNDLIYSYFMLYTPEQRASNHDELFEYYFRHFVQTLELLGCQTELLTFESFQQQLKRQRALALFLLVSFLPIRYALRAGLIDRDHLMATDEERRDLYYDKNYIAELHTLLPMYLQLGYLQ